nr:MAG TPA: hypothetical protein [Caudoviricetes sp.]
MDSLLTKMICMHILKGNRIWEHLLDYLTYLPVVTYLYCSSI